MRKYIHGIIGWIIGVGMTLSFSAHAEEIISLIGQKVEGSFPISIAGKQLEQQAAVISGSSYLPVRAIGEALNMEVTFDPNMGIEMKQKDGDIVTDAEKQALHQKAAEAIERSNKRDELTKQKNKEIEIKKPYQPIVDLYEASRNQTQYTEEQYKEAKKIVDEQNIKINDLNKQLDELNKQQ